jgi:hypothetical protein
MAAAPDVDRRLSVAMTDTVADKLANHLLRLDGEEDLCFAIWHPSVGRTRTTAVINSIFASRR